MSLRVMQTSDWHFGAGVLPGGHGFDESIIKQREKEEAELLELITETALKHEVDLVLVPGDLWDQEDVAFPLVRRIMDLLRELAPIPVVIVPGNHDFLGPESPYHDRVAARNGVIWPDNVYVIRSNRFETFNLPGLSGVSFTAAATGSNVPVTERLLGERLSRGTENLNVLLFHGSLETGGMISNSQTRLITAPFSADELLKQEFDYTALGHYHVHSVINNQAGQVVAAYSGSPFQRDFHERDKSCIIVMELEPGGIVAGSLKLVNTDTRRYLGVRVNLGSADNDTVAESLIRKSLEKKGSGPQDLVRIHLEGAYGSGPLWRPQFDPRNLAAGCDLLTGQLRPGFDLDSALQQSPEGSAQGVFLRRMKQLITEASTQSDSTGDSTAARHVRTLELAAQLGYEAFLGIQPELLAEPLWEKDDPDNS